MFEEDLPSNLPGWKFARFDKGGTLMCLLDIVSFYSLCHFYFFPGSNSDGSAFFTI